MSKNTRAHQDGFAHLLLIVIAVIVVAGIALAGWRVATMQKSSSTASDNSPSSQAAAAQSRCMTQLHDDIFCKFAAVEAANPIEKGAFAATLTSTNQGIISNISFQHDAKGNTSLILAGENGLPGETFIEYNHVEYMKADDQTVWTSLGAGAPNTTPASPSNDLSFLGSLLTIKITKLGTEACGSLTCYKYQFADSAQPNATQYIWFDNHGYLLREYKATGGLFGGLDMKLSYPTVNIAQPTPTQSFSTSLGQ